MNLTLIKNARMRIAQSPRELEHYRAQVKMEIFIALKSHAEMMFPGEFNRTDLGRIATEATNQLCGEVPVGNPPPLPQEIRAAAEKLVQRIKSGNSDVRIAASFMRWTKAAAQLMQLKNTLADNNLQAALELDPKNAFALTSKAYLAGYRGDFKAAIEYAKRAIEINPEIPEAWNELAGAYQATNQEELSRFAFSKAEALRGR